MRVCYFGTYRANYTRNQIMIEGLRRAGIDVEVCHEVLWHGIEDRVKAASGGWLRPKFLWRLVCAYARLIRHYVGCSDYDVMVLGYPFQLDAPLARILTWLKRRPLAADAFMSIYLVATERELVKKHPLTGQLMYWFEKFVLHLPDQVIVMSEDYVSWFQETYHISTDRFRLVLTGADDRIYHPVPGDVDATRFTILFYGTFIHTHGVLTIIEAAKLLQGESDIQFTLIGQGPLKEQAVKLVRQYNLNFVTFVDWVEREDLPTYVASADLCLGVFGTTPQAQMTIQNKIYEALAMAKPLLTGDSLAVRKHLEHGEHVYLCAMDDPEALAEAVLYLKQNPELRQRLAENGQRAFVDMFSVAKIGQCFEHHLNELVAQ